ncbi:MAG: hypothetical protein D3906_15300 [Candidatus Electrothrix sp. AUS1_2]|nr:hypothetical protein [Candidatus Electrothrix sp. AUS1_2]
MIFLYSAIFFWLLAVLVFFVKLYLFIRDQRHALYYESSVCFSLLLDHVDRNSKLALVSKVQ